MVVDYKTGVYEDYSDPLTPQMLTLALQTRADAVAILHTPRMGIPVVYASEATPDLIDAHRMRLIRALFRIGDGSMRPGHWCRWCRVRKTVAPPNTGTSSSVPVSSSSGWWVQTSRCPSSIAADST